MSNVWLLTVPKGEDDGAIVRELPVTESVSDCSTVVYEVRVVTGDRRGAGTIIHGNRTHKYNN